MAAIPTIYQPININLNLQIPTSVSSHVNQQVIIPTSFLVILKKTGREVEHFPPRSILIFIYAPSW